ncbi:MAG: DNA gyrase inhibitor YacG [Candidatus Rokubacteria bacterium RIFCSPLOWO2_02_FULL_68_19]|nr:MAG: DNA gyrase inhibitor YacG [Candidatus Rokubacteria bacterium RIFCSPLOWO2_02_FULL_68_19]
MTRSRCPACRREFVWQGNPHRPFCSLACRLIDLGTWLDEGYRIEGERPNEMERPDDVP